MAQFGANLGLELWENTKYNYTEHNNDFIPPETSLKVAYRRIFW